MIRVAANLLFVICILSLDISKFNMLNNLVLVFIFRCIVRRVAKLAVLSKEKAPLFCRKFLSYDRLEHSYILQNVADVHFFLKLTVVI